MLLRRRLLPVLGGGILLLAIAGLTLARDARGASNPASPSATAATAEQAGDRGIGFRPRLGRNLVHAVVTIDRDGTLMTFQVDRGTVASVGDGTITIDETGGASVTFATDDKTRVRKGGKRVAVGDLKKGDRVQVIGQVPTGHDQPLAMRIRVLQNIAG